MVHSLHTLPLGCPRIQAKKVAPKAGRGDHVAKDLGPDFDKAVKIPGKGLGLHITCVFPGKIIDNKW